MISEVEAYTWDIEMGNTIQGRLEQIKYLSELQSIYKINMKYILAIISSLFHNFYLAQNSLEIKIINDTIKKVSYFDQNNVIYTITNTSEKEYLLIVDETGFNEDPEYKAELFYIGLPNYYIYETIQPETRCSLLEAKKALTLRKIQIPKNSNFFAKGLLKIFDEHEMRRGL